MTRNRSASLTEEKKKENNKLNHFMTQNKRIWRGEDAPVFFFVFFFSSMGSFLSIQTDLPPVNRKCHIGKSLQIRGVTEAHKQDINLSQSTKKLNWRYQQTMQASQTKTQIFSWCSKTFTEIQPSWSFTTRQHITAHLKSHRVSPGLRMTYYTWNQCTNIKQK